MPAMQSYLQEVLDSLIEKVPPHRLKEARELLSKTYGQALSSPRAFRDEAVRLAYLASRMPATYAAVRAVLLELPKTVEPKRWLDVGAGPGTACWAAVDLFPNSEQFILIEKNREMLALGKQIGSHHPLLSKAVWQAPSHKNFDGFDPSFSSQPCARAEQLDASCLRTPRFAGQKNLDANPFKNFCGQALGEITPTFNEMADVAMFSYSLGEMDRPSDWIGAWWGSAIPLLVVIEPGTPRGFSLIRKTRDQILSLGGHIVAPCPHALACPMQQGDWCHFAVRVSRTKLQRYLKEGTLGYEDEKYSYLIASKRFFAASRFSRILRRPQKLSGRVLLTLCTPSGKAEEVCVTKSDGVNYRQARDAAWGDMYTPK